MRALHLSLASSLLLVLPLLASAAAPGPSEAERLYRAYEELNVPGNLAQPYYGGPPPRFIETQIALLLAIAGQPAKDAVPILMKIADEYLERVGDLGYERFDRSPLMALQIPIVESLARKATKAEIRERLEAFAKHPLIREFARGPALGVLAQQRVEAIPPRTDPDGARRRQVLFETLLANQSFPQLLRAPARLNALAERVIQTVGHDPLAAAKFLGPAADSPPRRYAADYAAVRVIALELSEGKPLDDREKTLFMDIAKRYVETFLPQVQKEKYPSRLLGDALLYLGALKGNEAIGGLLRDYGLEPRRPVEPAKPPQIVGEEAPEPEPEVALPETLANAVAAAKNSQEADADRLLGKLAAPAALPFLQETLASPATDPATRAAVLRALAHNGSEQAVYTLLSIPRRADDPKQLDPVVFALTEIRNPAALPALLEAFFDGTDNRLGGACTQVLARLPGAEKANSLVKAYRGQDFEAIPLLVALAKDPKSERGAFAGLAGLASLRMPEAVEALFDLIGEKAIRDSPEHLRAVERSLSYAVGDNAETPEVLVIALARLKAASPKIRQAAAESLAGVEGDLTVRKALEEAAQAEKDPDVAKAIKDLLREHPTRNPQPPPPVR